MAAQSSEAIDIIIKAKDQAGKTFKTLNQELKTTQTRVNSVGVAYSKLKGKLFNLKTAIGGVFVGLGMAALIKGTIETAAEFEQLERKLNVLTKGKGKETLDELNEWALTMPINTKGAIDVFSQMIAYGLNPTIAKMQTLVDVSTIFGQEAVPRIARALGQMQSLGKISQEEINQLSEVGINAAKYIREAWGKSVEQIRVEGVEVGKVIEVIWAGFARDYGGAAAKAQDSWKGMMTTLASYWTEFQRLIMEGEVFTFLKVGVRTIVDSIEKLRKSGDFGKWARSSALEVLDAFEAMTYVAAIFYKSLKGIELVYNGIAIVARTISKSATDSLISDLQGTVENLKSEEERLIKNIEGLRESGTRFMDEEAAEKQIDQNERMLVTVRQKINANEFSIGLRIKENQELEEQIELQKMMVRELAHMGDPGEKVLAFYDNLRKKTEATTIEMEKARKAKEFMEREGKTDPGIAKIVAPKLPEASELAKSRSLFSKVANDVELELAKIQSLYENSGLSLQDYFDKRAEQLKRGYDTEIKYLVKSKDSIDVKDQDKRLAVQDKIQAREIKYTIEKQKLDDERVKAERDLAKVRESIDTGILEKRIELEEQNVTDMERVLSLKLELMKRKQKEETDDLITNGADRKQLFEKFALDEIEQAQFVADEKKKIAKQQADFEKDINQRKLAVYSDAGILQQKFRLETDLLDRKHEEEMQKLTESKARQDQIEDLYAAQRLEKDQLAADQRLEIQRKLYGGITDILGNMTAAFGDLYEASGQKQKEYFKIQKAISIAQTLISTYLAAQESYSALAGIPYVGPFLGIAAAAAATVAGLARVAAIRSQNYAVGGEVKGYSPHKKADNIRANLTAGEYVHNVDSVKKYGLGFMESINNLSFPKNLISGMSFPVPKLQYASSYAEGGPVAAGAKGMGVNTNINVNVNNTGGEDSRTLGKDVSKAIKIEFNKNLQEQMRIGGLLYARR